ncbi:MAG: glycosyltransferase family 2 protein [Blastocatellia bacterium]|nr:glycosyltransferase family 2 protein [Blastocatellia bacterium]
MSESLTKVALVMPVYNRRDTTLQALKSLSRIDRSSLHVKIYVVDDGSTDGTSEAIARDYPETQLIQGDGTLHYAAGTNRGISAALEWEPDYVVTMNDDAVYHEQFLQRLIATARQRPRTIVGSLLLLWNEPHKVFQVGQVWNTWKGGWQIPEDWTAFSVPGSAFAVECIVGNCVLFPVDAIHECGLMDEKTFPHGWGDAQWLMRMRKAGWNLCIEPKSLVWCEPNTNPTPLHHLKPAEILRVLFLNKRHPLNLQRQFTARWQSAPSKSKAAVSYIIYLAELSGKTLKYVVKRRD